MNNFLGTSVADPGFVIPGSGSRDPKYKVTDPDFITPKLTFIFEVIQEKVTFQELKSFCQHGINNPCI